MVQVDTTFLGLLVVFACTGFVFLLIHFLNFVFSLGRKRAARESEREKMNETLEKILKKIDGK